MDFEMSYSAKQEEFRDDVRSWLAENVTPEALVDGPDARVTYAARRMLGGRLGMQGWLYPTAPARYGGGGLDPASALIIGEELRRLGLDRPPYYDTGGWLGSETILAWGTEEQKNRLLPPIYRGEVRTWQLLTEPEAGSDL
ncbi:MAG: acyl-CoA dehydrogenase family protein, partial [Aeromicrobium sp.]